MPVSLKGTRTEKNLLIAFAGESQARNRYSFFASKAKDEGFQAISKIFLETAEQEREHASRLFKFLEGGALEITATFPAGKIGTTLENLQAAAYGEHEENTDMYTSIDMVQEMLERQLRKYKTKLIAKHQEGGNFSPTFYESYDSDADDEVKIVRTKRFGIKPMYPEDACVQMELLGHDFYVFCNAETDEVNVVYKRKNGTFGLIEPEFR